MTAPRPFSRYEWMIAWRYLRARRAEGGVSAMTAISVIGIMLAVFALIATLSVRAGFRAEFVDTILGANAHLTVYPEGYGVPGAEAAVIADPEAAAERIRAVPGVTRVAPLVKGQVMASHAGRNIGVEVYGIRPADLMTIPRIVEPEESFGDIADFGGEGIAIGSRAAIEIGAGVGDVVQLISPNGVQTAFGTSPRVSNYRVAYIFTAGRFDIDRTRVYMPMQAARTYFDRDGVADELEVMVADPEAVGAFRGPVAAAAGGNVLLWSWREASGSFLRALEIEDNVMFVIMSILVLIASMNIVSGLIMLVKNKGRDIAVLRTIGLTEGAVTRVFFLCGAATGLLGTALGVVLGCLFAIYIDPIYKAVNWVSGGGVWDPSIRGIYDLPARLESGDVIAAIALSLGLSFAITYLPARRAARLDPVEALRYE